MLDDSDYASDSAYSLTLPASTRADAATDVSVRVDDGADVVIEVRGGAGVHINAYLTVDQAEELVAALAEIVKIPGDRTGAVLQDPTGVFKGG